MTQPPLSSTPQSAPMAVPPTFRIGTHTLGPLWLAHMAGVSDPPFRRLCAKWGAHAVVGEMLSSNQRLWHTPKSQRRFITASDPSPRIVQIAGADPIMMADAARAQVAMGADIIDINMGCPAKKVCNRAAGSALLRDEALVRDILSSVVHSVSVPVTLKMRTGWDHASKNALTIARLAESLGIAAITVHGRTRADRFMGEAEYDTVAMIKSQLKIPVIANGDIDSAEKAHWVLHHTGADGVMIGRAAQGKPWIFQEIFAYLHHQQSAAGPAPTTLRDIIHAHVDAMLSHHGVVDGVKISRKHLGWYRRHWLEQGRSEWATTEEARLFSLCLSSDDADALRSVIGDWLQVALAA